MDETWAKAALCSFKIEWKELGTMQIQSDPARALALLAREVSRKGHGPTMMAIIRLTPSVLLCSVGLDKGFRNRLFAEIGLWVKRFAIQADPNVRILIECSISCIGLQNTLTYFGLVQVPDDEVDLASVASVGTVVSELLRSQDIDSLAFSTVLGLVETIFLPELVDALEALDIIAYSGKLSQRLGTSADMTLVRSALVIAMKANIGGEVTRVAEAFGLDQAVVHAEFQDLLGSGECPPEDDDIAA